MMSFIPKAQEIYKHFKGNLYQITAIAEHTETGETLVVYQALYGDFKIYARPLAMFTSKVDREKYPDVAQEYRFELQGPEAGRQKAESEAAQPEAAQPEEPKAVTSEPEAPKTQQETEAEEGELDPMLLAFLDADSYEERRNILTGLHHRITDQMITTMAIACDVEVPAGSLEERFDQLRTCLQTLEKYECNRLR